MAHLLDEKKGTVAFAYVGQAGWHNLGNKLPSQPKKMKDVLIPAGLDFEVGKLPNKIIFPDGSEQLSDSYFTFRKDTIQGVDQYAVLGSHVGKDYNVLQNEEALNIIEPFFKRKDVSFETAGSLRDGKWTFICCKFNDPIVVDKNDVIDNYFVIFNSFDGSLSLMAYFTPTRVVCNNTLQMSFRSAKQKITLRHTMNLKNRMHEATRILIEGKKNGELFQERAQTMKKNIWKEKRFFDYLTNVFCTSAEIKEVRQGHPIEAVLSTRKRNIINDVYNYAYDGVGQKEANEMSGWWAYNAVTGYYSNQKNFTNQEKKAESMYFGGSARILENALTKAQPEYELMEISNLN